MRKLASVRIIKSITPIEGADNIELAHVDGWQCIVGKGQFKPGDTCAYFEIDSLLPEIPVYEFLRSRCYVNNRNGVGFRIRTMKLRGVISQGLALPFEGTPGNDLTELLDVKLYEVQPEGAGRAPTQGSWPWFLRKTDQERVQNLSEIPAGGYEVTEKLDGSSITVFRKDDRLGVCSRNWELKLDGSVWHEAAKPILDMLAYEGRNLAVQGELMGPGIQKNRKGLTSHQIYIFNVWDIDAQVYLRPDDAWNLVYGWSEIDPRIKYAPLFTDFYLGLDFMNEIAAKFSVDKADFEGVVFKHHELPFSFKYINPHYLIRNKL